MGLKVHQDVDKEPHAHFIHGTSTGPIHVQLISPRSSPIFTDFLHVQSYHM